MTVLAATAGFYFLLGAEFLAGIQLLVYVGGVVVLIVFVVMLTGSLGLMEDSPSFGRQVVAGLGALNFFLPVFGVLQFSTLPEISHEAVALPGADVIGELLLNFGKSGYVMAFELISVLLLVALIGGLVIARKGGKRREEAT
jgi:NADH-quinone oxidoreductase subunit J